MASEADQKMEITISQMLRAGVSLAAIVVFVGGFLYMLQAHGVTPDYRHFHGIAGPADRTDRVMVGAGVSVGETFGSSHHVVG